MKGLILSGGRGTRLRPLTYTSAKQLVPVANKPVLFYGIESIVAAGITEIGIIVGETRNEIQAAVGDGSRFGAYMFDSRIFESVRRIKPSARGELEITDAIQDLIDRGLDVHPHIVRGWWKDTGKLEDMLEANRIVLEGLEVRRGVLPEGIDGGSRIEGRVQIGEGVQMIDSLVRGPVVIGDGARLEHAFIGPYTSIGERCTLMRCEMENSIVLADCEIRDIP